MDDALLPKEYSSGTKWVGICAAVSAFIFVIVSVILAAASGSPSWVVAALGMFMIIGTTGAMLQWIRIGELEERRYYCFTGVKVLALLIISGAVLDILYTKVIPTYPVVGTVSGANLSPNVRTVGSISLNGGTPLRLTPGKVQPFVLAAEVPDGTPIAVSMVEQPGQAYCTAYGGGTVSGAVFNQINVSCIPMFNVGFALTGFVNGYTPLVIKYTIDSQSAMSQSLSADGTFFLPTKLAKGGSVAIQPVQQPASRDGKTKLQCDVSGGRVTISSTDPRDDIATDTIRCKPM